MADPFKSPNDAALAALREAAALSQEHEYAGVIYEKDGEIHYTAPATSGETHSVKIKVKFPKGAKLLGLYHTHPPGMDSDIFAGGDVDIAKQLNLPYYMGDLKNNRFNVFIPGESEVERKLHGQRQTWSRGTALGALLEQQKEQVEEARLKLAQAKAIAAQQGAIK